jgi:hypothetical protein
MAAVMDQDTFTRALFDILDETFEAHHGIFLDNGTSLFGTLATITAPEASRPVGDKCASLAAQVAHVMFYLDVIEHYIVAPSDSIDVDWNAIWQTIGAVTPDEWDSLRERLRQTYQRVLTTLRGQATWDNEDLIEGALAIVVHTAYHLGEIRQALCTLR